MNCYMVVLRHSHDDLPLLITSDPVEAADFAKAIIEDDGENEKQILGIDCCSPSCVAIYRFVGGKLVGWDNVRDLN